MARRALLVEDDGSIATVITAALEAEAFTRRPLRQHRRARRLLAERRYDVMLTDVVLADGDGIDTLGAVHARSIPTCR